MYQSRTRALGEEFVCWINDDNDGYGGSISCSGTNKKINNTISVSSSTNGWIQITGGGRHLCALSFNNDAFCWGGNTREIIYPHYNLHLIQNSFTNDLEYKDTQYKIKHIQAYKDTTCIISINGAIKCYGLDNLVLNLQNNILDMKKANAIYTSFSEQEICYVNKLNKLFCDGVILANINIPDNTVNSLSVFEKSGCSLYKKDTNTILTPICFGTLYSYYGSKYYDYTDRYGESNSIIQGNDWHCVINTNNEISCLGGYNKFSESGRDYSIFDNIRMLQSCVKEKTLIILTTENKIKIFGSIKNMVDLKQIDTAIIYV